MGNSFFLTVFRPGTDPAYTGVGGDNNAIVDIDWGWPSIYTYTSLLRKDATQITKINNR